MKKKLISLVLALALLVSLGVVMASAASGNATLYITTDKEEYAAGDTVKAAFKISSDTGIYGVAFTPAADSVLTFVSAEAGAQFGLEYAAEGSYAAVLPKSAGVTYEYDADGNITGVTGKAAGIKTATLMTVTYTVASSATAGTITDAITATVKELFSDDTAFTDINCTVAAADLTIKAASTVLPGDVNGDGVVNNKDLTRLQRYLAGWAVEINEANSDCNGDGVINNKDLTRLQRYLAGWAVTLG